MDTIIDQIENIEQQLSILKNTVLDNQSNQTEQDRELTIPHPTDGDDGIHLQYKDYRHDAEKALYELLEDTIGKLQSGEIDAGNHQEHIRVIRYHQLIIQNMAIIFRVGDKNPRESLVQAANRAIDLIESHHVQNGGASSRNTKANTKKGKERKKSSNAKKCTKP